MSYCLTCHVLAQEQQKWSSFGLPKHTGCRWINKQ